MKDEETSKNMCDFLNFVNSYAKRNELGGYYNFFFIKPRAMASLPPHHPVRARVKNTG
jgi:hypothetical protein